MLVPRGIVVGIAGGLLLMAFFTMSWAAVAANGLQGIFKIGVLMIFGLLSLLFIGNSLELALLSRKVLRSPIERGLGIKRMGSMFGLVFGIEGLAIFISARALTTSNHVNFVIPVIALIVGLHFIPMAKIFGRTIDYYIAAWTCIVALAGIELTAFAYSTNLVMVIVGIGAAIATSTYGIYMISIKRGLRA